MFLCSRLALHSFAYSFNVHFMYYYSLPARGGATVLKVGGDKLCERSEQKIFFDPPLFGQWGGQNIAYIDKSASLVRLLFF